LKSTATNDPVTVSPETKQTGADVMLVFVALIRVPLCAKVVVNVKVKFPLSGAVPIASHAS
jgi:hypothetical protein